MTGGRAATILLIFGGQTDTRQIGLSVDGLDSDRLSLVYYLLIALLL